MTRVPRRSGLIDGLVPRRAVYVLGVLSGAKALGLVLLAEAIARGVSSLARGDAQWQSALIVGVGAGLLRAAASWATTVVAARAAIGTKEAVRRQLADAMLAGGGKVGSATALATRGLDELDEYFTSVLPAITGLAVIPLLIGARILFADWVSAVVVVVTVPLIPLFMVLVGKHTSERTARAASALDRLSDNVVELARGLPVLVGLGRVKDQAAALERISDDYRITTMVTLRTAFLSSMVLELIAMISVAIVAVFVGIRLLAGDLGLQTGLLVLILVPECYAPLREFGAAYHASRAGTLALDRARTLVNVARRRISRDTSASIRVRALCVSFPGSGAHPVVNLSFSLPRIGITAVVGHSGSGKSTLIRALAGRLDDDAEFSGSIGGVDETRIAWVPQHPHTVSDTVRAELELYAEGVENASAEIARLSSILGIASLSAADPAQLSAGELRRIAVARAMLRVYAGATLLLLDEPTAHLDDASARAVIELIQEAGQRASVLVASHDQTIIALATHSIRVGTTSTRVDREAIVRLPDVTTAADPFTPVSLGAAHRHSMRALIMFLRPAAGRYIAAALAGTLAAGFAIALTAVSAWLIVRASDHAAMMYLLVAIVGVRFFGLGRAALRYCERLLTHDAVLGSTARLRMRLWAGLASLGANSRVLQRGGTALDYLVAGTDNVRDLVPRVVLPAFVGVAVSSAVVLTVGMLYPPAVLALIGMLLGALVIAPLTAVLADRASGIGRQDIRSGFLRKFSAMLGAADDLTGNGVNGHVQADLDAVDRLAGVASRRSALARGVGSAIVIVASSAGAMAMLAVSAGGIIAGRIDSETAAVLVLLPVALIDPLIGFVVAAQQWPVLAAALAHTSELDAPANSARRRPVTVLPAVRSVSITDVAATWPHSPVPAFSGLNTHVDSGEWLVVEGPSGSGKSTLLSVLLGYLEPSSGIVHVEGIDLESVHRAELLRHVAWCPQEAHLFDSTLRANLLLGRRRDDPPTEDEMSGALRAAGLENVVAKLFNGLDTRIGSEGSHLSGGERQRLAIARTLLSRAELVLLDEPTAHLDDDTAEELMRDLRVTMRDRIVVLVTHRADDVLATDHVVVLGRHAAPRVAVQV